MQLTRTARCCPAGDVVASSGSTLFPTPASFVESTGKCAKGTAHGSIRFTMVRCFTSCNTIDPPLRKQRIKQTLFIRCDIINELGINASRFIFFKIISMAFNFIIVFLEENPFVIDFTLNN